MAITITIETLEATDQMRGPKRGETPNNVGDGVTMGNGVPGMVWNMGKTHGGEKRRGSTHRSKRKKKRKKGREEKKRREQEN